MGGFLPVVDFGPYHIIYTEEAPSLRVVTDPPDDYFVFPDEVAVSTSRLKTGGFVTGVGLAITQGEQKLLAHVTHMSNEHALATVIKRNLNTAQPLRVTLIHGGGDPRDPLTGPATRKCIEALRVAGVQVQPDYYSRTGDFIAFVHFLQNHIIYRGGDWGSLQ
jgi:hypothetical protein